jgi:GNAT superfamily N-acetyltransferase
MLGGVVTSGRPDADAVERARAWHHGRHVGVCDVVEVWAHGTVVRATRYPNYYDLNLVRVEDDPPLSVRELVAIADRALAGLVHRRLDFDLVHVAQPLRQGFEAEGWMAERLVLMRLEERTPHGSDVAVETVPYDTVHELRVGWSREDLPDQDPIAWLAQAREVALRRDPQVLVVRNEQAPVAFAQIERVGDAAEITGVYVHPSRRGGGLGTALTRAAIEAAGSVRDLWIGADDEDRPKELYARLGFRPVVTLMEFTRLP